MKKKSLGGKRRSKSRSDSVTEANPNEAEVKKNEKPKINTDPSEKKGRRRRRSSRKSSKRRKSTTDSPSPAIQSHQNKVDDDAQYK